MSGIRKGTRGVSAGGLGRWQSGHWQFGPWAASFVSLAIVSPMARAQPDASAQETQAQETQAQETQAQETQAQETQAQESRPALAPLPEDRWPNVQVSVEPDGPLLVGDAVTVRFTVTSKEAYQGVTLAEQSFGPFDLLDTDVDRSTSSGTETYRFSATLLALEPGTHSLQLNLRILTADHALGSAPIPRLAFEVRSLIANEPNAAPKGSTAPRTVMESDYTILWVLLGLLIAAVVALLAFYLGRLWSRRQRREPAPPPPRPPWELAVERLDRLRQLLLHSQGNLDPVRFADELSDTLREYLGRRFGFDGLESTSQEVIAELKKRKQRSHVIEEVASLLGDLDLVKFAKAAPSEEQGQTQLDCGFRIVHSTRPSVEMPSVTTPAAPSAPAGEPA